MDVCPRKCHHQRMKPLDLIAKAAVCVLENAKHELHILGHMARLNAGEYDARKSSQDGTVFIIE